MNASGWQQPPPWRVAYDDARITLVLIRPDGAVAGEIAPYDVPEQRRGSGFFATMRSSLSDGVDAALWMQGRGRIRGGAPAVHFTMADGTPVELWNGRDGGWRRARRHGTLTIAGRKYEVRHLGRRRTALVHDGVRRTTLRRKGFGWGATADAAPSYVVRHGVPAPDAHDELAIVLAGSTLGPVGRPGWWAEFFNEFSP
ncbi:MULTISPECIES: hypothetical protein [unclassified Nocardioides]|uniref:hypothetical protein n=1 Tax=unclassified Nocardioides TaxID=2615069 RepID=UPI0007132A32|nr:MULTISPECIES: hypothetical protein [unclassified Nocardioides]KQY56513.1 hypothetical protein ASD30_09250 [Nocardioides sp. Root140]